MNIFRDPIWEGLSATIAIIGVIVGIWLFAFPQHRAKVQAWLSRSIKPVYFLLVFGASVGVLIASVLQDNGWYSPFNVSMQMIGASVGISLALMIFIGLYHRSRVTDILRNTIVRYLLLLILGLVVGSLVTRLYLASSYYGQLSQIEQQGLDSEQMLPGSPQSIPSSVSVGSDRNCVKPNVVDILSNSLFEQDSDSYFVVGKCLLDPRITFGGLDVPYDQITANAIRISELPPLSIDEKSELVISNAVLILRNDKYKYVSTNDVQDSDAKEISYNQLKLYQESVIVNEAEAPAVEKIWGTYEVYILGDQRDYFGDLYRTVGSVEIIRFDLDNYSDIQEKELYLVVHAVGIVPNEELIEGETPTQVLVNGNAYNLSAYWPYSVERESNYMAAIFYVPINYLHLQSGANVITLSAGELSNGTDMDNFVVDGLELFKVNTAVVSPTNTPISKPISTLQTSSETEPTISTGDDKDGVAVYLGYDNLDDFMASFEIPSEVRSRISVCPGGEEGKCLTVSEDPGQPDFHFRNITKCDINGKQANGISGIPVGFDGMVRGFTVRFCSTQ